MLFVFWFLVYKKQDIKEEAKARVWILKGMSYRVKRLTQERLPTLLSVKCFPILESHAVPRDVRARPICLNVSLKPEGRV